MPPSTQHPSQLPNKPVKHHHVNRAYLERFCLPDGELFQYFMRPGRDGVIKPKWTGGSPKRVAYVLHLYDSPADSAGQCHVEGELGQIEHPAMAKIVDILRTKPRSFDYSSHEQVVVYIAAMAMRTREALEIKEKIDPLSKAGLVVGEYPNNPGSDGILKDVDHIRSHLQTICWYLYWFDEKDGRTLVTSDLPVGLYALAESDPRDGNKALQPSPLEAAIPENWAKQAIFTFPLSSCCAALGFKGPKHRLDQILNSQLKLTSHASRAAWINAITAWMANHVYCRDQSALFLLPPPNSRVGTLDEYVPLVDAFNKANVIPLSPPALKTENPRSPSPAS